MPRTIATASLLLAVAMFGALAFSPLRLLVVTSSTGTIACTIVTIGSHATLEFTHSMYGGDVTEVYRVTSDNQLEREMFLTDNAAAAEYYAWTAEVHPVGDRYEVVAPPESFPELTVRVDQVGKHRFAVDTTIWNLAAMVDQSAQVRIRVETRPLLTHLAGTTC